MASPIVNRRREKASLLSHIPNPASLIIYFSMNVLIVHPTEKIKTIKPTERNAELIPSF